jgi:hypothetical protein
MSITTEFYSLCSNYLNNASYVEFHTRYETGARELDFRDSIRKHKKSKKHYKFHMKETWEKLQSLLRDFHDQEDTLLKRMAMKKYNEIVLLQNK